MTRRIIRSTLAIVAAGAFALSLGSCMSNGGDSKKSMDSTMSSSTMKSSDSMSNDKKSSSDSSMNSNNTMSSDSSMNSNSTMSK